MTAWPSDEDVRKALVALHGHADVFPVHYEQVRQALLAGTEGLRAELARRDAEQLKRIEEFAARPSRFNLRDMPR